uniref:Zeta toxin domain-containing protein n=1 Tax=viral metagenome TaxID=1070528 RepID=A0A6C0EAS3_9ZZZZ
MDKLEIYKTKLNTSVKKLKYLHKIASMLFLQMYGGSNLVKYSDTKQIYENYKHLNKYLLGQFRNLIKSTNGKYFIILMGSPGVGKTQTRRVAIKYIAKLENNDDYDNINSSFIDINTDNYVYDLDLNNKGEIGRDKFNKLKDSQDWQKKSTETYFNMRKHINPVGEIVMSLGSYVGSNIFFETIGTNKEYLIQLVNFANYYEYKPIIIYTEVKNEKEHINRVISRANNEGRFPDIEYVKNTRITTKKVFNSLKKSKINVTLMKYKNNKKIDDYDFDLDKFTRVYKN